jgi:hypothetical protein
LEVLQLGQDQAQSIWIRILDPALGDFDHLAPDCIALAGGHDTAAARSGA